MSIKLIAPYCRKCSFGCIRYCEHRMKFFVYIKVSFIYLFIPVAATEVKYTKLKSGIQHKIDFKCNITLIDYRA
jgi:hypothetical protein